MLPSYPKIRNCQNFRYSSRPSTIKYIELTIKMHQPLATIYVNIGDHLPKPTLTLYPHTCIPHLVRQFMDSYDLPEPVFQAMCEQIEDQLGTQNFMTRHSTIENYGFDLATQSRRNQRLSHGTVGRSSSKLKPRMKQPDITYTPFYRLFINDENLPPNGQSEAGSGGKTRKKSLLCQKQKNKRKGRKSCKSLNKKGNAQQVFGDQGSLLKIRQLFKFITRNNAEGILTNDTASKLTKGSPRLADLVGKIIKQSKSGRVDEQNFVLTAKKLNIFQHLSRDVSKSKKRKTRKLIE